MYDFFFLQVVAKGCWLSPSEKHHKKDAASGNCFVGTPIFLQTVPKYSQNSSETAKTDAN